MNLTQEQIAQIENAPILYEWETLGYPGKHMHRVRLILSIAMFFFFLGCAIYTELYITFIIVAIVMSFGTQFFMLADYQYHYYLTRNGYYYTSYQKVPEFGYKLTAIFMVLGVVVAIVGTMVIGPMAFVGGGMFLLTGILGKGLPLGPDLTREYNEFHSDFKYILFIITEKNQISINTNPMRIRLTDMINYPPEEQDKLISILCKILLKPEIYYVKNDDEYVNHPRIKELVESQVD
ncbi:hypothetical protein [Celerinatantimonas sp. MCCC 1A17872]|uniref:hypothetical protein n=1 Tax=Celerinatantimonas sp. MCCC 1A17872 TaxID=3177514 RepID=UPI0038CA9E57